MIGKPIFESILYYVGKAAVMALSSALNAVCINLGPTLNYFYETFLKEDTISRLFSIVIYSGYLLAMGIFIYHIVLIGLGKLGDDDGKSTVFTLLARLIAAFLVVTTGTLIPNQLLAVMNNIWLFGENSKYSISYDEAYNDGFLNEMENIRDIDDLYDSLGSSEYYKNAYNLTDEEAEEVAEYIDEDEKHWYEYFFPVAKVTSTLTGGPVAGILTGLITSTASNTATNIEIQTNDDLTDIQKQIIMGHSDEDAIIYGIVILVTIIVIIYEIIKFSLEIIKRYIVMVFTIQFFPLAVATCVAPSTAQVFRSYLINLLCSTYLVICSSLFAKGFYLLFSAGGLKDILAAVMLVAYLQLAQQIDRHLKGIGLSVAQSSGGGMLGSVLGAAFALRTLAGIGQTAVHSSGSAMKGIGIISGQPDVYSVGSQLAKGPAVNSMQALSDIKNNPLNISGISPQTMRSTVANAVARNDYNTLTNANTMSNELKSAALEGYLGSPISSLETSSSIVDTNSIAFGSNGSATFDMLTKTNNGDNSPFLRTAYSISPNANNSTLGDAMGTSVGNKYMMSSTGVKNYIAGEKYSLSDQKSVEIATGLPLSEKGIEGASKFSIFENGKTIVYDSNDNPLYGQDHKGNDIYGVNHDQIEAENFAYGNSYGFLETDEKILKASDYDKENKNISFITSSGKHYELYETLHNPKVNGKILHAGEKGCFTIKERNISPTEREQFFPKN